MKKRIKKANNKGENWPAYMKEMAELGPKLRMMEERVDGQIKQADLIFRKKAQKKIMKKAHEIRRYEQAKVNEWIEKELKAILPEWAIYFCRKGKRWPLKLFGIKINYVHYGTPQPLGADDISIYVWGQPHAHQRFVWEI